jgi:two-component system sensor histidine kinase PhoQ
MVESRSKGSLTRRLLLSAAFLMVLFLGLTGYALDRAFYNSQLAAQSERLYIRIFTLMSLSEMDGDTLTLPRALREQRFNSPESGLVALVLDDTRFSIWESLSSEWFNEGQWIRSLPNLELGEEEFGLFKNWVYTRTAFGWEEPNGDLYYSEYWVLENAEPLNEAIQTFRSQLWGSIAAVTVALLIGLSIVMTWGLRPLRVMAVQLNRIRSGEANVLSGDYPKELFPLTDSLNRLIQAEQGQRERYRKAMGDLAHSLKTPLAVMRTVSGKDQTDIHEQVNRMDQIVRYQLQRAVTDARTGPVLGQRCDLTGALERLSNALEKAFINEDKVLDLPESREPVYVAMDSNDVLEVLGNLIENGFKYGRSVISVDIEVSQDYVYLHVDDDGPGVSEAQRKHVLTRGKRLDSLQPGQGIGLAMVNDILASYNVDLSIDKSPLGGARFSLVLPKAD